jgi:hypothetical protein
MPPDEQEALFDLPLLQAVNDWQRGGNAEKRGETLAARCAALPLRFRSCSLLCYRQEAHEAGRLWQMLIDRRLPQRICAWTTDLDVAKTFKGGVPPAGLQGVIFFVMPPPNSVILNLVELYSDNAFRKAVESRRGEIVGFHDGIGRYKGDQAEIILDLPQSAECQILCLGGFVGTVEQLAEEDLKRRPTKDEIAAFAGNLGATDVLAGDQWWLSPEGSRNVMHRIQPKLAELRQRADRDHDT